MTTQTEMVDRRAQHSTCPNPILEAALSYLAAGRSIIATGANKVPLISSWSQFQKERPTEAQIRAWFSNGRARIAMIMGEISGNTEGIDIDEPNILGEWTDLVEEKAPGLIGRLTRESSPHGHHAFYCCPAITIPGSTKLAERGVNVTEAVLQRLSDLGVKASDKAAVDNALSKISLPYRHKNYCPQRFGDRYYIIVPLVETKAEGGYILVAPSEGYSLTQGNLIDMPEVTAEERDILLDCARMLNEWVHPDEVEGSPRECSSGDDRPGDVFNREGDIRPLLRERGWTYVKSIGTTERWRRPGKDRGWSASLLSGEVFYNFSSGAHPFRAWQSYSKFAVYAALTCDGDFSEAARRLAQDGYGEHVEPGDGEWPTPLDIFGSTSLVGEPDFPLDTLPWPLGDFVQDHAERIGVVPSMIAMPCLVAAAAVTADFWKLQPKRHDTDYKESARLWCVCIADPGEKKTPAEGPPLKPIIDITVDLLRSYQLKAESYADQMVLYKKSKTGMEKPVAPILVKLVVDEITIESMVKVLKNNPRGVVCVRDELSGWLGSFDAYKQSKQASMDRPAWLQAWNGGPRFIDRVRDEDGGVYVPNWSCSIYGGIQPGPMRRLMGSLSDDGLCARFIPFYGRRAKEFDRPPNYTISESYRDTLKRLWSMIPEPGHETVQLAPDAHEYREMIDHLADHTSVLPDTSTAFKGHLGKWRTNYARLLLTLHMFDAAARNLTHPPKLVTAAMAENAAKIMTQFFLPNAARFYAEISGDSAKRNDARWIAGYILSRDEPITKISERDIGRAFNRLLDDKEGIRRAMDSLAFYGWVRPIENKGRPPTRWEINPRVYKTFGEQAEIERERRQRERERIQEAIRFLGLSKTEAPDENL